MKMGVFVSMDSANQNDGFLALQHELSTVRQELTDRQNDLNVLHEVAGTIGQCNTAEDVFRLLLPHVARAANCEFQAALLFRPNGAELFLANAVAELPASAMQQLLDTTARLTGRSYERAAVTAHPLETSIENLSPNVPKFEPLAAVPLMGNDVTLGLLFVGSTSGQPILDEQSPRSRHPRPAVGGCTGTDRRVLHDRSSADADRHAIAADRCDSSRCPTERCLRQYRRSRIVDQVLSGKSRRKTGTIRRSAIFGSGSPRSDRSAIAERLRR